MYMCMFVEARGISTQTVQACKHIYMYVRGYVYEYVYIICGCIYEYVCHICICMS